MKRNFGSLKSICKCVKNLSICFNTCIGLSQVVLKTVCLFCLLFCVKVWKKLNKCKLITTNGWIWMQKDFSQKLINSFSFFSIEQSPDQWVDKIEKKSDYIIALFVSYTHRVRVSHTLNSNRKRIEKILYFWDYWRLVAVIW